MEEYLKVIEFLLNKYKNKIIKLETSFSINGKYIITIAVLGKHDYVITVGDGEYYPRQLGKNLKKCNFETMCEEVDYYFS